MRDCVQMGAPRKETKGRWRCSGKKRRRTDPILVIFRKGNATLSRALTTVVTKSHRRKCNAKIISESELRWLRPAPAVEVQDILISRW